MTIGAIGSNPLFFLGKQPETRVDAPSDWQSAKNIPANPAGAATILPVASAPQLSFESVLALQNLDEPPTLEAMSPTEIFLEEARKSPMERMREQVLDELGLSEEALAQMSPEERRVAEEKIREMIEEKLRQAMGADRQRPDSNAALLQDLA